MTTTSSAAIVGLGRVGSRFDEEPGRTTVWSHAGAYLARPRLFTLAATCELASDNSAAFGRRCPDVPVVKDVKSMLDLAKPSVVSICTEVHSHAPVLGEVLQGDSVRVVWCEKPLAANAEQAAAMVNAARARDVMLVVSYVRRWAPVWIRARELAHGGALGAIRVVRIAIPNRLLSMGSHAVDLIQFIGGPIIDVTPFPIPELAEEGEPAVGAFFRLAREGYGLFQVTGVKANYLVEGEIVGDNGRLIVREDRETITLERFNDSVRYQGYRQLGTQEIEQVSCASDFSPFVAIVDEIAELLAGRRREPTCDGAAALAVQRSLERMARSATSTPPQHQ